MSEFAMLAMIGPFGLCAQMLAADTDQPVPPKFEMSLVIHNGKENSGSNCRANPAKVVGDASRVRVTQKLTCGHKGSVSEVAWVYRGHQDGKDLYTVTRKFPSDGDAAKTTKVEIKYAGVRQVLFEDQFQCIVMEPPPLAKANKAKSKQ